MATSSLIYKYPIRTQPSSKCSQSRHDRKGNDLAEISFRRGAVAIHKKTTLKPNQIKPMQKPFTFSLLLTISSLGGIFLAQGLTESLSNNSRIASQEAQLCSMYPDQQFTWCK